ncbi:OmpH family outer membrane protein [Flavilitoribacter nigricans]|nr:OmpH family outer membrane protein [Flavilitoribacter nigricans]
MKKIVLMLAMSLAVVGTGVAQKYGHCNFGSLVSAMPGTKQADTELEAYQKQLVSKGEEMATAFQQKVTQYYTDQQSGDFTPKVLADREQALQQEQQTIMAYEQEIQQKLGAKREELLKPLVEQVEAAISKVAKANGYVMIFDTSMFNSILFAEEAVDITAQVKTELGIE